MVKVKCDTVEKVTLQELVPFQGSLKKRTQLDVDGLISSIMDEGLLTPFIVWDHDSKLLLLDGHGRREALTRIALEKDAEALTQKFPMIRIMADTEEDARKALLQINSQYGKITKKGLAEFTVKIPEYKAPILGRPKVPKVKTSNVQPVENKKSEYSVLRIRVPAEHVEQVRALLNQTGYIEVL